MECPGGASVLWDPRAIFFIVIEITIQTGHVNGFDQAITFSWSGFTLT